MEGSNEKTIEQVNDEGESDSIIQRHIFDVSNVFSTFWLRYAFQTDDGLNRILLGSRYSFLLYFRLFLVIIYLTYETIKQI
jgi:hypothetical protein